MGLEKKSLPIDSDERVISNPSAIVTINHNRQGVRVMGNCWRRKYSAGTSPVPVALPEELIYYGILSRLPVRLLLRFTTVCTAWCRVILRDAVFARVQAQSPTPASAGLARFHRGRFEILTPGGDAAALALAPPDPRLSFLSVHAGHDLDLDLCAVTSGLLCLLADGILFVVNPATRAFHSIPYRGFGDLRPCLAYDPSTAHLKGYHLAVPVPQDVQDVGLWRFRLFSSGDARLGWRESRAAVRLPPLEKLHPKPKYVSGRAHWLCYRGDVVWYDAEGDVAGKLAPPGEKKPSQAGGYLERNRDLVAWRGRIGMVWVSTAGLGVWALSSEYGNSPAARWEMVHWKVWDAIPGVLRPSLRFLWSVVPAGMEEAGGEEAVGLAVRIAHRRLGKDVWLRAVVRYDLRTGATVAVAELGGKEIHDELGAVFGYHSTMAPLPALNL